MNTAFSFPASFTLAAGIGTGMIDMMRTPFPTTRRLVASSLIACLGLTALLPQGTALADTEPRKAVVEQPVACCCGTEDGSCCGMGCCVARQAPPKDPCPCPLQKDTRDGQRNLIALPLNETLDDGQDNAANPATGRSSDKTNRSQLAPSLQAKHVRLNA